MPEWNCERLVYHNSGNRPLLQLVPLAVPGLALDCGCGAGDNARVLREAMWSVIGITISPDEAANARQYCESVHIADLERGLPADIEGPFDLILFSHVLEHLRDPHRALRDAKSLLRPGGHIAVALPNVMFWRQRLEFLFGRFQYSDSGIMDHTHLRFYTFVSGRQLLEANGLHVVREAAEGWFPSRYLRRIVPECSRKLDSFAARLLPGLFGNQILYLCVPASRASNGNATTSRVLNGE